MKVKDDRLRGICRQGDAEGQFEDGKGENGENAVV